MQRSDISLDDLFAKFNRFKRQVLASRPTTAISIVTIPPVSFARFQATKHLSSPILTESELKHNQRQLDLLLDQANARIRSVNTELQFGFSTRTLSWHTSVRKPSKRKNRSSYYTSLRNDFSQLYDGLHAKSTLKRKWYNELLKCFEIDTRALQQQLD